MIRNSKQELYMTVLLVFALIARNNLLYCHLHIGLEIVSFIAKNDRNISGNVAVYYHISV